MDGEKDESLKSRLGGTSALKAGLESVDRRAIDEKIYHLSKGSAYFNNEQKKDEALNDKVASLLKQRDQILRDNWWLLKRDEYALDKEISEWEQVDRDLSQTIVHVDLDAFYASVHELEDPSLREKPMGVGGSGVLSTANYAARKYGVRSAMPTYIAKKLCPELVLVRVDFAKYKAYAAKVRAVLKRFDKDFCSAGLDEAYLNLTSYLLENSNMTASEAVATMRGQIEAETGLTASAGIAANGTLAKICSDLNKPNGQFELARNRDAILEHMAKLNVRRIPGVGKVTERLLHCLDIHVGADIIANRALIHRLFSKKLSRFLCRSALGFGGAFFVANEESGDYSGRKSVSVERTFAPICGRANLEEKLAQLAATLASYGFSGKTLTLKLKKTDFQVLSKAITLDKFIKSKEEFQCIATNELLAKELQREPKLAIRLMGLRLSSLETSHNRNAGPSIKDLLTKSTQLSTDNGDASEEVQTVECPVCAKLLPLGARDGTHYLNEHLDRCLEQNKNRDTKRQRTGILDGWLVKPKN